MISLRHCQQNHQFLMNLQSCCHGLLKVALISNRLARYMIGWLLPENFTAADSAPRRRRPVVLRICKTRLFKKRCKRQSTIIRTHLKCESICLKLQGQATQIWKMPIGHFNDEWTQSDHCCCPQLVRLKSHWPPALIDITNSERRECPKVHHWGKSK